ncbi:hypothetical protein Nepgr_013879 [Nepenthes gracilis]|uniref:DUF7815 domain-containing protein n=1 Tax=Nepenthes gracilis TaxID=150966 RepID=A0AAD3SIY0_NEPGR|nr:hypothetical protein Nepgr_013879 [Nepenthes gracilis]
MAYEFPSDLLVQVQILLRREAGLEYYNPSDSSSLSNPPTLEEAIANFETSSDCLRCKHCKGALLRGSQSIICVYCGREPDKEFPPEPISFKSTVGYRWLLESLGLDGSEILGPPIEDSQTNKGRLSINESSLSDFLDLEVKWPNELERFGVTVPNEAQMMGKVFLNSDDGVGFDDYFSGARRESVSSISNEQLVPNETRRSNEVKHLRERVMLDHLKISSRLGLLGSLMRLNKVIPSLVGRQIFNLLILVLNKRTQNQLFL